MPGIEPGTFHMQSERSTAELQPHLLIYHGVSSSNGKKIIFIKDV